MASSTDSKGKWVVVSLSPVGERETDIKIITGAVRRILARGDLEVFVPAVSKQARNESHTAFYMDGYVFIRHLDGVPYVKLQDTTYFGQVLCTRERGSVAYSLVDDSVLDPLRKGVENLSVCKFAIGDRVRVTKGEYRLLKGTVRIVNKETVLVDVSQRSKPMLIEFPVIYLQKMDQ